MEIQRHVRCASDSAHLFATCGLVNVSPKRLSENVKLKGNYQVFGNLFKL
jgi:hypothetical protein